jgi:hypothetical protein
MLKDEIEKKIKIIKQTDPSQPKLTYQMHDLVMKLE